MEKLDFKLTITLIAALAARLLMEDMDAELKMEGVDAEWRRETRFGLGEMNKHLDKALGHIEKAKAVYDRFIDPSMDICFNDKKTKKFDVAAHDNSMKDANEAIRLLMLHYDRCFKNPENTGKIFAFLEGLEGRGIFTEQDIEQFNK